MSSSAKKTYGGFPRPSSDEFPGTKRKFFSSFRVALLRYLETSDHNIVWMPYFYCHEVTNYLGNAVTINLYHINERFRPEIKSLQGGVLVYPNYFGICDAQVADVLVDYGKENVILDYAHSLAKPPECLASISSLRKLLPVPDGAEIRGAENVPEAGLEDLSLEQVAQLTAQDQAIAYKAYLENEGAFTMALRSGMSKETFIALSCADFGHIAEQRTRNFDTLSRLLGSSNQLKGLSATNCPLCYPFLPKVALEKEALLADGLFLPQYWPNPLKEKLNEFETRLTEEVLYLPVSQKLDIVSMEEVAQIVRKAMEKSR